MAAVRGFLVTFGAVFTVLMVLVSVVLVGATLMNEFAAMTDMARALVASVALSAVLAVPLAAAGYCGQYQRVVRC